MALTQHCDVFGRLNESAFNRIITEVMLQRPDIFNYATKRVIDNDRFCTPIAMDNVLRSIGGQSCTEIDPIPIIGSEDSTSGLDLSLQLKELKLDFAPETEITLPDELGDLAIQQFAIKGKVCAGLGCGSMFRLLFTPVTATTGSTRRVASGNTRSASSRTVTAIRPGGLNFMPIIPLKMHCFCLSLYLKAVFVRTDTHLSLRLSGIELEDIEPIGLENSIECYLKEVLDHTVFPKVKIALEDLVFNIGEYFSISPTPTSAQVPHNPLVDDNAISLFININS